MVYDAQYDSSEEAAGAPRRGAAGDLQRAWIWAGARIALGLGILAAGIGFRMSQVSPAETLPEPESGVRAFAEQPAEPARTADAAAASAADSEAHSANSESGLLGRVQGRLLGPAKERDAADRMVSCSLRGGTRFMTAADCAARGGGATLFEPRVDEAG